MTLCAVESVSTGSPSIGPVENEETIYRAAYDPSAGRLGKIRPSLIDKKALAAGELSVWRADGNTQWTAKDVAAVLKNLPPQPNRSLFAIVGVTALDIRQQRAANTRLCVPDETTCDQNGAKHSHHAHISPCRQKLSIPTDPDSDEIRALKDALWGLYNKAIKAGRAVTVA